MLRVSGWRRFSDLRGASGRWCAPGRYGHLRHRLESPRRASTQHKYRQHRLKAPGALRHNTDTDSTASKAPGALRSRDGASLRLLPVPARRAGTSLRASARFARLQCLLRPGSRSAPAPFIPTRGLDRPGASLRLDGPSSCNSSKPHPPQPIRSFAPCGAHSLIPRTRVSRTRATATGSSSRRSASSETPKVESPHHSMTTPIASVRSSSSEA